MVQAHSGPATPMAKNVSEQRLGYQRDESSHYVAQHERADASHRATGQVLSASAIRANPYISQSFNAARDRADNNRDGDPSTITVSNRSTGRHRAAPPPSLRLNGATNVDIRSVNCRASLGRQFFPGTVCFSDDGTVSNPVAANAVAVVQQLREKSPEKYSELAAKLIAAVEPKAEGYNSANSWQEIAALVCMIRQRSKLRPQWKPIATSLPVLSRYATPRKSPCNDLAFC
jgi:hypothetical protein